MSDLSDPGGKLVRDGLDAVTRARGQHSTASADPVSELDGITLPPSLMAQLGAALASRLNVSSGLTKPYLIAHQGTNLVVPDHTREAYRYAYAHGLRVMDMDARVLSDGALANIHNQNLSGFVPSRSDDVSTVSPLAWSLLNRDPTAWPGWPSTLPVQTIADNFREFGQSAAYAVEAKDGTSTTVQKIVDLATALGVQQQVIVQCTVLSALAPAVSAGMKAMHITDTPDPVALAAAGVTMVCINATAGSTVIQNAVTAGLRVWVWNVTRHYDYAWVSAITGVEGIVSDDPVYTLGKAKGDYAYKRSADPFAAGMYPTGHLQGLNSRGSFVSGRLQYAAGVNAWTLLGWLGPITATTYTITWTITFDAVGSSSSAFQGLHICAPDDRAYTDNSGASGYSNGYRIDFQQNGIFRFHRTDRTGSALVDLAGGISNITPANGGTATVNVQVTPTTITINVPSTGKSYSFADSTYRGGYVHVGQSGLGAGFQASVSAISVA